MYEMIRQQVWFITNHHQAFSIKNHLIRTYDLQLQKRSLSLQSTIYEYVKKLLVKSIIYKNMV